MKTEYLATFSCEFCFEVNATNELEAKAKAKELLASWFAENAEASDFSVTVEINQESEVQ